MCDIEIACAKYCYEGRALENPWSSLQYGGDTPHYYDPVSGLDDRGAWGRFQIKQPCEKNPIHRESSLDENTPLASADLSDGDFNGFDIGNSAVDTGNFDQVFDKRRKRTVQR